MSVQEAVVHVLTGPNSWIIIIALIFLIILGTILTKKGFIYISTDKFHVGADYKEREIIRAQCEWSHTYIMGLYSKINPTESKYHGYFTRYILECMCSEVVNWITFNHIRTDPEYLMTKQSIIRHMLYSMNDVDEEFKSKEFSDQMNEWVKEVVTTLVRIRETYK